MSAQTAALTIQADGGVTAVGDPSPLVVRLLFASGPVNALTRPFLRGLREAIEAIPPGARVVVLASAIPGVFMAGGDIETLRQRDPDARESYVKDLQGTFGLLAALPCPVISQVEGHCLGGGLELALAGDLVVASQDATFGLPEARLGILPGAGGVHRLVRRVGEGRARLLMLTGRRVDAAAAATYAIVDELCPPGAAAKAVEAIVKEILATTPTAVAAIKRLSNAALDIPVAQGLGRELEQWKQVRAEPEAQAALDDFADSRGMRG